MGKNINQNTIGEIYKTKIHIGEIYKPKYHRGEIKTRKGKLKFFEDHNFGDFYEFAENKPLVFIGCKINRTKKMVFGGSTNFLNNPSFFFCSKNDTWVIWRFTEKKKLYSEVELE